MLLSANPNRYGTGQPVRVTQGYAPMGVPAMLRYRTMPQVAVVPNGLGALTPANFAQPAIYTGQNALVRSPWVAPASGLGSYNRVGYPGMPQGLGELNFDGYGIFGTGLFENGLDFASWGYGEWGIVLGLGGFLAFHLLFAPNAKARRQALRKADDQYRAKRAAIYEKYPVHKTGFSWL